MQDALQLDPQTAMLLVMDYQPGILGMLPGAEELIERAARAIAAARQAGMAVGYVRVAFTEEDYAAVPPQSRFYPRAVSRAMTDGEPHTAVHPAVAPLPGDVVVRKTRVGAFSTTDLDAQLRARGIDTLVLAGVSTSGVVLSTVRDASDRDYRLFVLADATADRDPEVHRVLIEKVLAAQADIISTDDLLGALAQ